MKISLNALMAHHHLDGLRLELVFSMAGFTPHDSVVSRCLGLLVLLMF